MANVSPGVYDKIIDLSEYVQNVPGTIGFIAIISEKGPDNVLVETNGRDFYRTFGEPNILYGGKDFSQGPYVASNFLKESDSLFVIRCCSPYDSDTTTGNESSTFSNLAIFVDDDADSDDDYADDYPTDQTNTGTINTYVSSIENMYTKSHMNAYLTSSPTLYSLDGGSRRAALFFHGVGRGDYYNRYLIKISKPANPSLQAKRVYILDIYKRQLDKPTDLSTDAPNYYSNSLSTEWSYSIVQSFEVSFNPSMLDSGGESMFVADVVNRYFDDIKCLANTDLLSQLESLADAGRITLNWEEKFDVTEAQYYDPNVSYYSGTFDSTVLSNISSYTYYIDSINAFQVANGDNGALFTTGPTGATYINSTVANQILAKAYLGLLSKNTEVNDYCNEVLDTENHYFNIVFDAGYPSQVKDAIAVLTRTRRDCLAIIDNFDNSNASMAIARRNGTDDYDFSEGDVTNDTFSYNSKYIAIYEGYSKVFDPFTGRYLWLSPVYHMANIIPYTDNVAEIWYPPAGFNRGTISGITELRYTPLLGERDDMYLQQLNPIVKFSVGYTVWGQLTSQRRASALQDVNVVRLVLYIKRALENYCKWYIFDLNDTSTWGQISDNCNKFLKTIQNKRGLYSYSVDVGADDYEKKQKKCHVNIILEPVKALEQIELNFYIK